MKNYVFLILASWWLNPAAANVELIGKTEEILFDKVKEAQIAKTVKMLLSDCTTKIPVKRIPNVSYKAVRVTTDRGEIIEAHILPNGLDTFVVKIYTKENDEFYLHGKYQNYAYQLISMLEVKI